MSVNVSPTPNQEKVIKELLQGKTIIDAASACGIADRTVYRWFKNSDFLSAYSEARQQLLNQSITALQLKFDKAVETLDKHTNNALTIPRDQIRAAEIIVEKVLQTAELTKRIAELEAQLQEQQQDMMYKVMFDLRKLTKEDRAALEGIYARSRENA